MSTIVLRGQDSTNEMFASLRHTGFDFIKEGEDDEDSGNLAESDESSEEGEISTSPMKKEGRRSAEEVKEEEIKGDSLMAQLGEFRS